MSTLRTLLLSACVALGPVVAPAALAQGVQPSEGFVTARVERIQQEYVEESYGTVRTVQTVLLRILDGPDARTAIVVDNGVLDGRRDMLLTEGERLVLRRLQRVDGEVQYLIAEKYRFPAVLWLVAGFFLLSFIFGGWTGLRSLLGLVVSILVLVLFVVPRIVAGDQPMLVSLAGAFVIACTSLYLAHGFHRRTTVALGSTLVTLALSTIVAVLCVHVAKLFGMGTEESMFLQIGQFQAVNLRGLLLGGIIIGCLGVLDDVTTAQTAAIDEIRKANPSLTARDLQRAGFSVGKEHIASLINTLALAYAGASLPLLLLFSANAEYPLWVTLNSEFLAEEIVRTLVGSVTLLLAVPISTWFAATFLRGAGGGGGHHHHHHGFHGHAH